MDDFTQKLIRVPTSLLISIKAIAETENTNSMQIIEKALKYYRDYYYMKNSATFVNNEIIKIFQENIDSLLQQINNKSNKLLSELAIQTAIQNLIMSDELDVDDVRLKEYRMKALEFLKANNRILRLDELV